MDAKRVFFIRCGVLPPSCPVFCFAHTIPAAFSALAVIFQRTEAAAIVGLAIGGTCFLDIDQPRSLS